MGPYLQKAAYALLKRLIPHQLILLELTGSNTKYQVGIDFGEKLAYWKSCLGADLFLLLGLSYAGDTKNQSGI